MATRKSSKGPVGYGRPPAEHQFKAGKSGNPKGRPKGSRNFDTDVVRLLAMPVPVEKDGKRRRVSTQEAALLRLREKALKGDARSLERLVEFAMQHSVANEADDQATPLEAEDQVILDAYYEARRRNEAEASASPGAPSQLKKDTK